MHSSELLHRLRSLRSQRELPGATYTARVQNLACGDDLALHLKCNSQGIATDATFTGHGCALCLVSADLWCLNAREQDKEYLQKMSLQTASDRLGFDPGILRSRCASLVIEAWQKIAIIWEV